MERLNQPRPRGAGGADDPDAAGPGAAPPIINGAITGAVAGAITRGVSSLVPLGPLSPSEIGATKPAPGGSGADAAGRAAAESEPGPLRDFLEDLARADPSPPGTAPGEPGGGAAEGKYVVEREIGHGGMGRVLLAFDRSIRRRVAVKVIQPHLARDRQGLARFIEEAQITGQLEHPAIPPIHELGINRDQEVFFTMKLVRGRTLKEIIKDLHIGRRSIRERYSLKRLLAILQSVANAVHFAHEKGVIHRDIKPENIMVGDFGEVQLMDWGLAKVIGASDRSREGIEEPVETLRTESGMASLHGTIQGTLQYMAPEQAQGRNELVDQRSDIYSLGATLYEVLTFQPPFTGKTVGELLEESRLGLTVPPRERAPKQKIPPVLEEICLKAMEYHPDDRYQTAQLLADDLQVFLDGTREEERRRTEAERLLGEARKVLREHDLEKRAFKALEREVEELGNSSLRTFPRSEDRRRARELRASMERKGIAVATLYTRAQTILSAALASEPENGAVKRLLADLYVERFLQADREGNQADLIFYRGLIEQVNDGSLDRVLRGDGMLAIETTPGSAAMTLLRYQEAEGILRPADEVWKGTGPLSLGELPMGSYLLLLEREDCEPARFPVLIRRNQEVRAMVKLYPRGTIAPGFAYVPEGPFLCLGDPRVPSAGREPQVRSLESFAIGVHPVTCAEYREFLEELMAIDREEALRRRPRESESSGHHWILGEGDHIAYPKDARYPFSDRLPVFGVSFQDALAYCQWRSTRDGRRYDLPTEFEWEKAARGVDGRSFAWGNTFELHYCNNHFAREGARGVVSVDDYAEDVSPYGVRGMTGNLGDLCYDAIDPRPEVAGLRGGNWALTEDACRLTVRRQVLTTYVSDRIGFRLKQVL